ncbi:MAG: RNA-directed DNA polymerase, partial [Nanoarchaeota archaeon]
TSFCKKGMPLGNLTSQFFANVYLNELDYFVKHKLKAKYYIRYVDDFVILHESEEQLEIWKKEIDEFLKNKLKIELHFQKSRIISLSRGVDFVGFRNFYHYRLLRKRNIKNMVLKINKYKTRNLSNNKLLESFQGWNAYAQWANSYVLRKNIYKELYSSQIIPTGIFPILEL